MEQFFPKLKHVMETRDADGSLCHRYELNKEPLLVRCRVDYDEVYIETDMDIAGFIRKRKAARGSASPNG